MPRVTWLACAGLLLAAGSAGAQPALRVACSAETPTVAVGETVRLRAWASGAAPQTVRFHWEAPVGRLQGSGGEAAWSLAGLRPGVYAAAVRAATGQAEGPECVVRVAVRRDAAGRGPGGALPAPARETGSALLPAGASEAEGYGLYSYLLLGAPPGAATRERVLRVIEAVLRLVPEVSQLEQYVPRNDLNVAYLPVTGAWEGAPTAEWVLTSYDHARARAILRLLGNSYRDGPYLVSAPTPLGGREPPGPRLFQDLSAVPPALASEWVKEFLNQAAQERFTDDRAGPRLALRLRTTVAVLGAGLPEVRRAIDSWIEWIR